MNFLRGKGASNADDATPRYARREIGQGAQPDEIFEVWGDLLDLSDRQPAEIAALGRWAVQRMHEQLNALLDSADGKHFDFKFEFYSDAQDQPYLLLVKWGELRGELGARPFGRCLDLFGLLVLPQKWTADPNPMVRMAKLSAARRRDVTIFQTLLKYTLDQLGEAIDEQRIV